MEYIQAQMVEGGSMPILKHGLGQPVTSVPFLKVILWQCDSFVIFLNPHILVHLQEGARSFPTMHLGQVNRLYQSQPANLFDHLEENAQHKTTKVRHQCH